MGGGGPRLIRSFQAGSRLTNPVVDLGEKPAGRRPRKSEARKQLREPTHRSRELARRGRSLRNKLVAVLQSAYGVESYELLGFGINPRLQTSL